MKVPNTSELREQHALCGQAQTCSSVLVLTVWRKYQPQVPLQDVYDGDWPLTERPTLENS